MGVVFIGGRCLITHNGLVSILRVAVKAVGRYLVVSYENLVVTYSHGFYLLVAVLLLLF